MFHYVETQTSAIKDSAVEDTSPYIVLPVLVPSFPYPPKGLNQCMHGEGALIRLE
jgi:hypothetical protein